MKMIKYINFILKSIYELPKAKKENLLIKRYEDPYDNSYSCTVLEKSNSGKSTGVLFKDLPEDFTKEILLKNYDIIYEELPIKNYIWKDGKWVLTK